MSVSLSPIGGAAAQFFTNAGVPLAGGKIYTYGAGGSTPVATYTTVVGNIQHANPIELNAAGRVSGGGEIWLTDGQAYKFAIYDSANNLIGTYDNIIGISAGYSPQNFTGNGTTTNFTLSSAPLNENTTFVYINGVYQNKNTYSISGTSLIFSEAPPVTSIIEILVN